MYIYVTVLNVPPSRPVGTFVYHNGFGANGLEVAVYLDDKFT